MYRIEQEFVAWAAKKGYSENLENYSHILIDSFMEEKAEVLEDNSHGPSQLVYFMIGNSKNIPPVNNNLALCRKNFSEDYFKKSCFS